MPNVARARLGPTRLAVLSLTTLSSLASSSSDVQAMACTLQPPVIVNRCPPLRQYTPQQSMEIGRARAELRLKEPENILLRVTDDAFATREQCRAIERKQ